MGHGFRLATGLPFGDWRADSRGLVAGDGRYLLSVTGQRNRETGTDIWVVPFSDKKAFLYVRTEFNEDNSKLSPDGRWLASLKTLLETGRVKDPDLAAWILESAPISTTRPAHQFPRLHGPH